MSVTARPNDRVLAICCLLVQAPQFPNRALQHHGPVPLEVGSIDLENVLHHVDALVIKLFADARTNAQDFTGWGCSKHCVAFLFSQSIEIADLGQFCRLGAGFASACLAMWLPAWPGFWYLPVRH